LYSALEVAREKERSKENGCDVTKEKEEEEYQEVNNEKMKEEEKKNGREKVRGKDKGKDKEKAKEKAKVKERNKEERTDELKNADIRDIKNEGGGRTHTHGMNVNATASTRASLASVVWNRRAVAVSNTTSKPRLEQVHNKSTELSPFLFYFLLYFLINHRCSIFLSFI
jgi:archaellum component FlaD/FlaE